MKKILFLILALTSIMPIFAQNKGKTVTQTAVKFDSVQAIKYMEGPDTIINFREARGLIKPVNDSLTSLKNSLGYETVSRTIYISNNGSDSNDGTTMGTAFATLSKAFSTVKNNINQGVIITMQLDSGTYNITDVFGRLSKFNGSGTIAFNGLMRATPITVATQSASSLWTKINTYNESSSFTLTKSALKGLFAGTDLATMYPIIDNTTDSIEKINYSNQCTSIYTPKSFLVSTGNNTSNYSFKIQILFSLMGLNFSNTKMTFLGYPYLEIKNCIIDNEASLSFGSPGRFYLGRNCLNTISITLYPNVSTSGITYNYFKPFNTVIASNMARININGICAAYSNYFEAPHAQMSNCIGIFLNYNGGISENSSFTIGGKNLNFVIRLNSGNLTGQLQRSNSYLFLDSVNYIERVYDVGSRGINSIFNKKTILNSKGIVTSPLTDYISVPSVMNLYDYNGGIIAYVIGIHYPPIETKLSSTCTYNASTTIPIASTTYNSAVEIKYSLTRGSSTYFGTFTIIPGTTPVYENTYFPGDSNLGVTMTAVQDATTTTQTNWVITVDNTSTNNATIQYNVSRTMK